ncbi:MAG: methyltransferase domain-containing protein [Crenarchaeota archaeon]|nr:methyltransferase domain-containing protein [Thermoproteota archaeon]
MEVLYFLTSGTHRTLPLEELEALHEAYSCPLRTLSVHYNLVLAEGNYECSKITMKRSAFIKEMGKVCAICDETSCSWFEECAGRIRKRKLGGFEVPEVSVKLPEGEDKIYAIATEGFYIISKDPAKRLRGKSPRGPFFSPGSMDPLLARAMVNLARVKEGERLLDPFCGTGSIAHEAARVGAVPYCADLDPSMAYGSKINTEYLKLTCEHVLEDSASLPFRSSAFHAIATDPPYGRSVVSLAHGAEELLREFLSEASRVLKPSSWVVFAASTSVEVGDLLRGLPLRLNKCHVMRVHRSLARYVCTAYTGSKG